MGDHIVTLIPAEEKLLNWALTERGITIGEFLQENIRGRLIGATFHVMNEHTNLQPEKMTNQELIDLVMAANLANTPEHIAEQFKRLVGV